MLSDGAVAKEDAVTDATDGATAATAYDFNAPLGA